MKTELTGEQVQAFRTDGFLVVPDFLSPAELTELGAAVDEAVATMGSRKITSGPDWRDGDGYYDRVFAFRRRRNSWHRPLLVGLAFACQRVDHIDLGVGAAGEKLRQPVFLGLRDDKKPGEVVLGS